MIARIIVAQHYPKSSNQRHPHIWIARHTEYLFGIVGHSYEDMAVGFSNVKIATGCLPARSQMSRRSLTCQTRKAILSCSGTISQAELKKHTRLSAVRSWAWLDPQCHSKGRAQTNQQPCLSRALLPQHGYKPASKGEQLANEGGCHVRRITWDKHVGRRASDLELTEGLCRGQRRHGSHVRRDADSASTTQPIKPGGCACLRLSMSQAFRTKPKNMTLVSPTKWCLSPKERPSMLAARTIQEPP